MCFSVFLQEIILKQFVRKELLAKIQLSSDYFSGLDAVTFSRWVNGVTSPAPFKQILIASITGNLDEYINTFLKIPKCKKTDEKYNLFLERFSNYYFNLSHNITKNEHIYHTKGNYSKISEITNLYTGKYQFYDRALKNSQLKYHIFHIGEINKNAAMSFIAFTTNVNRYLDLVSKATTREIKSDNFFGIIDLSFFCNKNHYETLIGLLFNLIIYTQKNLSEILFLTRGNDSLTWHEHAGGKLICRLETSSEYGDIYLFSVEIKKALNNSKILKSVKNTNQIYKDMNHKTSINT